MTDLNELAARERAAVVAWLRDAAKECANYGDKKGNGGDLKRQGRLYFADEMFRHAADAIERGEHNPTGETS